MSLIKLIRIFLGKDKILLELGVMKKDSIKQAENEKKRITKLVTVIEESTTADIARALGLLK